MIYDALRSLLPGALARYVMHFEASIEDAVSNFAKALPRGVRVLDLRHPDSLSDLVKRGVEHANALLTGFGCGTRADVDDTIAGLRAVAPRLFPVAPVLFIDPFAAHAATPSALP